MFLVSASVKIIIIIKKKNAEVIKFLGILKKHVPRIKQIYVKKKQCSVE